MRTLSLFGLIAVIGCRTEPEKVINVAPVFTNIVIVPDSNITSSTELLCVANAVAQNNDQLLLDYQWTKTDGSVIGEFDVLQLSPDIVGPTEKSPVQQCDDAEGVTTVSVVLRTLFQSQQCHHRKALSLRACWNVHSMLKIPIQKNPALYTWTQNGTEVGTDSSLQLGRFLLK